LEGADYAFWVSALHQRSHVSSESAQPRDAMNLHSLDFLRASPARLVASRLVEKLGFAPQPLSAQQLVDLATTRSGRRDLGDTHVTESLYGNLERLLTAIDHGATLTFNGRALLRDFVVDALANRLEVIAWDRQHPNVFKTPVQAPIFIVGLPASGISYLHQLLAQDPANRVPIAWEVASPVPPPSAYSFARDPRIDATDLMYTSIKRRLSTSQKLPLLDARVAQDCSLLMASGGASEVFSMAMQVPAYRSWMQSGDMSPSYLWHRQMLQHLQSAYMSERWVLKSPQHLGHLAALTSVYPDARFILVHRDPEQAMVEHLAFCRQLRRIMHVRPFADTNAPEEIVYWAHAMDRAAAFFKSQPQTPIAHIRYSDLQRRPLKTVETIYEMLAPKFSEPAYKRIDDFVNRQLSEIRPAWDVAGNSMQSVSMALSEQVATAFGRYRKAFADYLD
jgi:hypothetical protein